MSTIFPGSASVGQIFDGYTFDGKNIIDYGIYDTDFNNQFEYKNGGVDKIVREFKPGSYISLGLKVKI
jgi:hypothetical protein